MKAGLRASLALIQQTAARALPWIAGVLLLALQTGLWPELLSEASKQYIPLGLALIAFLVGVVVEVVFSSSKKLDGLAETVVGLRRSLEETGHASGDRLFKLSDCTEDLAAQAARLESIEETSMDWLGMALTRAWRFVEEDLFAHPTIRVIRVRVLMTVGPPGPGYPEEVLGWQEGGQKKLKQVQEWFEEEAPGWSAENRVVDIRIRTYGDIPTVHGFHIKKPFEARYLSFCRWSGRHWKKYEWGERCYRKVTGEKKLMAPGDRDLAQLFDAQFEHLWAENKATEVHLKA